MRESTLLDASSSHSHRVVRGDLPARLVGMLVMGAGITIILGVLWLAFGMFQDPKLLSTTKSSKDLATTATDVALGFGRIFIKIALLFLSSLCGSMIATKGINLYFAGVGDNKKNSEE